MKSTTQHQLKKLLSSITALHKAGKDYREQLNKFKPLYDSATPDEQVEIRNTVAQLVGKLYGTKPIMLKTGVLGFERGSAESKYLRRTLPVDKVSTQPTVSKQVDKVALRAKKLKADFTKAELRRLVSLLNV